MKNTLQVTETATVSMSSREIAELTGKRHDHVMTDIQKMLADLDLHAPEFSGAQKIHSAQFWAVYKYQQLTDEFKF